VIDGISPNQFHAGKQGAFTWPMHCNITMFERFAARGNVLAIKRLHGSISPQHSMVELLVGLQLDEGLASSTRPAWVQGSSVEEIFDALEILGDGEWLGSRCPDLGIYEASDRWLNDFFEGKTVPTPEDTSTDWPCSTDA
jgi:hypothetical protein